MDDAFLVFQTITVEGNVMVMYENAEVAFDRGAFNPLVPLMISEEVEDALAVAAYEYLLVLPV